METVDIATDEIYRIGERVYERLHEELERNHWGRYIAVNVKSGDYVIGQTLSQARRAFTERFGAAPGWCSRIGIPILAH